MTLQMGLNQQQIMKLTMTQELRQAITLLQYSTQELCEFLENKAIENPLFQIKSSNVQTIDHRSNYVKKSSQDNKQNWIEQLDKKELSIMDHLLAQIDFYTNNNKIKRVMTFLINSLDENGYLPISIEEVAATLHVAKQEVEYATSIIQELEPAGVGARNLQECLLLQMNRKAEKHELAIMIVTKYFTEFAEKKWNIIRSKLGIDMKDIQDVSDFVQTLNPRPASDFYANQSPYIIPDIIVKWDGQDFLVSMYDDALPQIKFNKSYYHYFNSMGNKQVEHFLRDKKQDYQWILQSIEQRKEMITKVILKIVEKQPAFFIDGPEHLKPMKMKEVSEELDIHESTVSRVVREKYVQTPYGTFELKFFFSSTIKTTSNEDVSSIKVKRAISDLIDEEDKFKPLSDQDLVKLLKESNGIDVSRRTIAKYRDQLGIPSSSKRKRFI